ncbi:MAG: phosphate uptake regulator PhoU [Bacteroidales bacterium]|jgi:phosphate transport system protein|nr:phosphate uptake regulator PhoU [Bacteroidales bacterium]
MSEKKEQALNEIKNSFNEMASLVLRQLTMTEKLMGTSDDQAFKSLIDEMEKAENRIDNLEVIIGEQFTSTIVLYQPVASDVRRLVAIYRMTVNLERIGDRIHNLCRIIGTIRNTTEYASTSSLIGNMLASGSIMVEKALLSFTNSDPDYAIWTIKNDTVVDEMNHKLLLGHLRRENIDEKTRSMVQSYIELKDMISNIERIADHATNIAEASIYSLQGTDIRHTGIGKEETG